MLNLASLIIGLVAFLFALVAFVPLLGWLNWLIIPLALIGTLVERVEDGAQPQPVRDRRRGPSPDAWRRDILSVSAT